MYAYNTRAEERGFAEQRQFFPARKGANARERVCDSK